MYFFRSISKEIQSIHLAFNDYPKPKRLVIGSILSSLATLFHLAGGILPVIGYFISPLATAPILICTVFSKSLGFISYLISILLIFVLVPSELIVFPFTTGLLGLGIGMAFHFFEKRLSILFCGSLFLTIGIMVLLYGIKFPILGPSVSSSFNYSIVGSIFIFTILYSWIWVEVSFVYLKVVSRLIIFFHL
jgi:hypothetical protein